MRFYAFEGYLRKLERERELIAENQSFKYFATLLGNMSTPSYL